MKAIHLFSKLLSAFLLISGAGLSPLVHSDVQAASQAEVDAMFADNTQTYQTTNADEKTIVSMIGEIKLSYEVFDVSTFQSVLSPDFQFVYFHSDTDALVDSRESFLKYRRKWRVSSGDINRKLIYSIHSITSDVTGTLITVWTFSTYKSKYFDPRFLGMMVFEKLSERWMLKRQVLVPLHPSKPKSYDVQIFVSQSDWAEKRRFRRRLRRKGPDWFIDRFRKDSVDGIPGDETEHTVLFVFREPPPPGSRIRTEHQFERPWAGILRPYSFTYEIEKSQPFFVIANKTQAGGSGGTITFTVFLDDTKIGEKTVRIY